MCVTLVLPPLMILISCLYFFKQQVFRDVHAQACVCVCV